MFSQKTKQNKREKKIIKSKTIKVIINEKIRKNLFVSNKLIYLKLFTGFVHSSATSSRVGGVLELAFKLENGRKKEEIYQRNFKFLINEFIPIKKTKIKEIGGIFNVHWPFFFSFLFVFWIVWNENCYFFFVCFGGVFSFFLFCFVFQL